MPSVLVTNSSHFVRGPSGNVYSGGSPMDYAFWSRYLSVFDRVGVAARLRQAADEPENLRRADGDGVFFHPIPDYYGPWQHLRNRPQLGRLLREAANQHDCFCLRVPCFLGKLTSQILRGRGTAFGLEVVGDPYESLAPTTVRSIARPFARWSAVRALKRECREACAVSYVTQHALQRRYPAGKQAFSIGCSDIDLHEEAYVSQPRTALHEPPRLILVGTLQVAYKGVDVLIEALRIAKRQDVELTIVGDGRERPTLERQAREAGLADRVNFTGRLPSGGPVRNALDAADIFVMPSRTEGLPRALLEAMARGLPCIATCVGGIPELLPAGALMEPGDPRALADKIDEYLNDPARLVAESRRNLETAREYAHNILAAKRLEFYQELLRRSAPA